MSRILYEKCFPEDSEEFVDYYYAEKCRDNRILAAAEGGEIISMIHLNPFTVSLCGQPAAVHYLVAVATAEEYRRRGIMLQLMQRALHDLYLAGEPFTFLMPANPDYYYSSGFEYWENQIRLVQDQDTVFASGTQLNEARVTDCAALAACSNRLLAEQFDLYVLRDEAYYRRLLKEQESENGKVIIMRRPPEPGAEPKMYGSFCIAREGGVEIREPILPDSCTESINPVMMGRILNPERFCGMIKRAQRVSMDVVLRDAMIRDNNGAFRIRIDKNGGEAVRIKGDEAPAGRAGKGPAERTAGGESPSGDEISMDIAKLSKLLFGDLRIYINEVV